MTEIPYSSGEFPEFNLHHQKIGGILETTPYHVATYYQLAKPAYAFASQRVNYINSTVITHPLRAYFRQQNQDVVYEHHQVSLGLGLVPMGIPASEAKESVTTRLRR